MIMNKINYSSLKKTLTKKEMKNITGGSGWCYWESPTDRGCALDEISAIFMACGGFWCCNCSDDYAIAMCG